MCKITDILIDKTSHKTNLRVFSFSELKRERERDAVSCYMIQKYTAIRQITTTSI